MKQLSNRIPSEHRAAASGIGNAYYRCLPRITCTGMAACRSWATKLCHPLLALSRIARTVRRSVPSVNLCRQVKYWTPAVRFTDINGTRLFIGDGGCNFVHLPPGTGKRLVVVTAALLLCHQAVQDPPPDDQDYWPPPRRLAVSITFRKDQGVVRWVSIPLTVLLPVKNVSSLFP